MSRNPGWKLTMSYPEGWEQLPTTDKDKAGLWVEQTARNTVGRQGAPDGPAARDAVAARAADLTRLASAARARNDWYALAFYPSFARGLVASLDIKAYLPGREYRTMTLDALEEIFGGPSADTVGEAVVSREKLPGGPAVRVRRMHVEDADPTGHGTLVEGVTHAIQPQGIDGAVVATMSWTALQIGDKLAEMADAIARTIRVTPA
jgi:hypothetical protein